MIQGKLHSVVLKAFILARNLNKHLVTHEQTNGNYLSILQFFSSFYNVIMVILVICKIQFFLLYWSYLFKTGSRSTCPLWSRYPVRSKNGSYFIGINLKIRRISLMYVVFSKNTTWTRTKVEYFKIMLWLPSNIIFIKYMILFLSTF